MTAELNLLKKNSRKNGQLAIPVHPHSKLAREEAANLFANFSGS